MKLETIHGTEEELLVCVGIMLTVVIKQILGCPSIDSSQQDFPPLEPDAIVRQKNEGKWSFTLDESNDR